MTEKYTERKLTLPPGCKDPKNMTQEEKGKAYTCKSEQSAIILSTHLCYFLSTLTKISYFCFVAQFLEQYKSELITLNELVIKNKW